MNRNIIIWKEIISKSVRQRHSSKKYNILSWRYSSDDQLKSIDLVVLLMSWCLVSFWWNSWRVVYQQKHLCCNYFFPFGQPEFLLFSVPMTRTGEMAMSNLLVGCVQTGGAGWLITTLHFTNFAGSQPTVETNSSIRTPLTHTVTNITSYLCVELLDSALPLVPSHKALKVITGLGIVDGHNMNVNKPGVWQKLTVAPAKLYSSCKIISHAMKTPDGGH